MKKTTVLLSIAFLFSSLLAGCNTMHGMGQDIEKGGQKIQKSSKRDN
ncbi:MAG TPA: entericidin A/B family lipoprotein [Burkholderiaceae bacterium]|nr:entericidin A/B family lipoprotein [Burkholderiaceae bacterium]